MQNPFLQRGYLLPTASVNKLEIDALPINGVCDTLHKLAMDLFSSTVLNEKIEVFLNANGIEFSESDKFEVYKNCLTHDGTAAAYAINEDGAAVLTLGTAIGVGFAQKNFDFAYSVI